jgi:hypothetical protein
MAKIDSHQCMTEKAFEELDKKIGKMLPRWLQILLDRMSAVDTAMRRDVLDVFPTFNHWRAVGQKHHFMRPPDKTVFEAYKENLEWIRSNTFIAIKNIREAYDKLIEAQSGPLRKKITQDILVFYQNQVCFPLGYALHAVQDSFTESHAKRVKSGDIWKIKDILVYDKANKTPHGTWPGHAALDKGVCDTPLGKEAVTASRELIRLVIFSATRKSKDEMNKVAASLWTTYVELFLDNAIDKEKGV